MERKATEGKQAMNIRLSAAGRQLLDTLAREKGISRTAVIELAIRAYAREEGVREGAE